MTTYEDTGIIHVTPDNDFRKHICHGDVCPCDPYKTKGGNVVIHRNFRKDE